MGIFGDFISGFSKNSQKIQENYENLKLKDDYSVIYVWKYGDSAEQRAATKILAERYPDEEQRRMIIARRNR